MRSAYIRGRDIEREALGLLSWIDEFVNEVYDHSGNSLVQSGEWDEVLANLRIALSILDSQKK